MRTPTFSILFSTSLFVVAAAGCDEPAGATVSLQFGERAAVEYRLAEDPVALEAELADAEDARVCEGPAEPLTIAFAQDDAQIGRHVGCATPEVYADIVDELAASDADDAVEFRGGYIDPCGVCGSTGDEYQCCRCGGGSIWLCRMWF